MSYNLEIHLRQQSSAKLFSHVPFKQTLQNKLKCESLETNCYTNNLKSDLIYFVHSLSMFKCCNLLKCSSSTENICENISFYIFYSIFADIAKFVSSDILLTQVNCGFASMDELFSMPLATSIVLNQHNTNYTKI